MYFEEGNFYNEITKYVFCKKLNGFMSLCLSNKRTNWITQSDFKRFYISPNGTMVSLVTKENESLNEENLFIMNNQILRVKGTNNKKK